MQQIASKDDIDNPLDKHFVAIEGKDLRTVIESMISKGICIMLTDMQFNVVFTYSFETVCSQTIYLKWKLF